jgi:hypothetical protein
VAQEVLPFLDPRGRVLGGERTGEGDADHSLKLLVTGDTRCARGAPVLIGQGHFVDSSRSLGARKVEESAVSSNARLTPRVQNERGRWRAVEITRTSVRHSVLRHSGWRRRRTRGPRLRRSVLPRGGGSR